MQWFKQAEGKPAVMTCNQEAVARGFRTVLAAVHLTFRRSASDPLCSFDPSVFSPSGELYRGKRHENRHWICFLWKIHVTSTIGDIISCWYFQHFLPFIQFEDPSGYVQHGWWGTAGWLRRSSSAGTPVGPFWQVCAKSSETVKLQIT